MWIWGDTAVGRAKGVAALEDGLIEADVGIGIEDLQWEVEREPGQDEEAKALAQA